MDFEGKAHYPIDLDDLPKGWAVAFVGDVCADVQSGFASGEHNSAGRGIPHLRPMNIDRSGRLDMDVIKSVSVDVDARRLHRGDVLFNNTNSPVLVGKSAAISRDDDFAFSNHMTRLVPAVGVDHQLLARHLHYLWMSGYFLHRCSKHVNQASVSSQTLEATVPVAVPPSPEQPRIVGAIDSYLTRLDDAVASLERAQAKLKAYRASVLKAAVEGRLVPTEASLARAEKREYEPAEAPLARILKERRRRWEEAELAKLNAAGKTPKDERWKAGYEEPNAPDTTALHKLPRGWCWATGDQLALLITKGASPNWQGFDYCEEGIPFVRSQNVRWGQLDLRDMARLPDRFNAKERKSILRARDVLLNLVGASIGRAAIATSEIAGGNCNQAVGIIRLVPNGMPSEFFLLCLLSPEGQRRINQEIVETARANISLEDVRLMVFPMPPIAEQERIVAEVQRHESLIDAAVTATTTNQRRCGRLRQAILKWAFEGRLVDQDANDEPAEELLARIRAERATAASPTKKRGRTEKGAA